MGKTMHIKTSNEIPTQRRKQFGYTKGEMVKSEQVFRTKDEENEFLLSYIVCPRIDSIFRLR